MTHTLKKLAQVDLLKKLNNNCTPDKFAFIDCIRF